MQNIRNEQNSANNIDTVNTADTVDTADTVGTTDAENSVDLIDAKFKKISENKKHSVQSIPIVLIDNSGSTASKITINNKLRMKKKNAKFSKFAMGLSTTYDSVTTLEYEVDVIQKKLTELDCSQCYIMFWNTDQTHAKDPINVSDIKNVMKEMKIGSSGGTDVSIAIHNIPDSWYQKNAHIFIVTDGEVNQDKHQFYKQTFILAKKYVNIHIITVERNSCDYMEDNVTAGSNIFKVLQENKSTKYVRTFECYNEFHINEPFMNLCNPYVNKYQFSYKGFVFNNDKFNDFVNIICEIINLKKDDKKYLDKIMYHLSFTVFSYSRGKSPRIKNEIVKLLAGLFSEVYDDTDKLISIFESESESHIEGACKTFQQYKANRKKLFEKTLDDLKNNVAECFGKKTSYMSFIINTTVKNTKKVIVSNRTNSYVRLSDTFYNNGGIQYGNHYIPMMPLDTNSDDEGNQALRQWIRGIYARVHKMQANDERIMYIFLTDMMSVVLSDLPEKIKAGWKLCARMMLNAKRFNSGDVKQIIFLTMGNKPKPMLSGYFTMDEIFAYCVNHFNPVSGLTSDEIWYGICLAYGYDRLIKAQVPVGYDTTTLLNKLKKYNSTYLYENVEVEDYIEYIDYVTGEDISETGGYKFPNYKYFKKTFKSSLLVSNSTYENLVISSTNGCTKCPITGKEVQLSKFIKILPKSQNNKNGTFDDSNFNMKIFDKRYFQRVNLIEMDKMDLVKIPIRSADSFDFDNYPYEFYPAVPIITEKLYKEREQHITLDAFKKQIKLRFDWLENVNMENVAIAGGFVRSIIFDEKVNDIDFYMYGLADDNEYLKVLSRLVTDITNALSNKYTNMVHLVAYKKEFNVYEIMYFDNVNKIEKEQYELQDLIQMKFIVKIQIIMKKHEASSDIFNTFDIDACCALYNSENIYFNERAYLAYRYLVSVPRCDQFYTDIFDMRMMKYYKSGFRIALPRLTIDQVKEKMDENDNIVFNKCKFHVQQIENNNIFVDNYELLIEKVEKVIKENEKTEIEQNDLDKKGMSIYNSVIGDIGNLDDSRSIVRFMKYVQRQNRLVERVRKNAADGVVVNDTDLINGIDNEIREETKNKLASLKLKNKRYVKHEALASESDEIEEFEEVEEIEEVEEVEQVEQYNKNDTQKILPKIELVTHDGEPLKAPEEYIRVYYKVSTVGDSKLINEFDNGKCDLIFIWNYDNYHKGKDNWYDSNVEASNKLIEERMAQQLSA